MPQFIAPKPIILKGKHREIVNLEKVSTFTYQKSDSENYGYIKFTFQKGHDQVWVFLDDASMKSTLQEIYQMLNMPWSDENF